MAIDERHRHEMYLSLERALGREAADTLMKHLPPVGWADVATKGDIESLRAFTESKIESTRDAILAELHRSQRNLAIGMVTVFSLLNGIMFTALKLS